MLKKSILFCWLLTLFGSATGSTLQLLPPSDYPKIISLMERALFPGGKRTIEKVALTYESINPLSPDVVNIFEAGYRKGGHYYEVLRRGGAVISRKEFDGRRLMISGTDGKMSETYDPVQLALAKINLKMSNPGSLPTDVLDDFKIYTGSREFEIRGTAEGFKLKFTVDGENMLVSGLEIELLPMANTIKTRYIDYSSYQNIKLPQTIESSFMNVTLKSKLIKAEIKFQPGEEK